MTAETVTDERLEDRMASHGESVEGILVEWRFGALYLFDPIDKALIILDEAGAAHLKIIIEERIA